MQKDTGDPLAGSGHSPKGRAASASPAKPSVPNAETWLPWSSKGKPYGSMPIAPGTLVDVRYRDGHALANLEAGKDTGPLYRDAEKRFWVQERHHSDIMFWRLASCDRSGGAGESAVGSEASETPKEGPRIYLPGEE
jgi:hypothetical protein